MDDTDDMDDMDDGESIMRPSMTKAGVPKGRDRRAYGRSVSKERLPLNAL